MANTCIQCGLVPEHGQVLLTRQRPMLRSSSTYQICLACASRIAREQEARLAEALRVAESAGV